MSVYDREWYRESVKEQNKKNGRVVDFSKVLKSREAAEAMYAELEPHRKKQVKPTAKSNMPRPSRTSSILTNLYMIASPFIMDMLLSPLLNRFGLSDHSLVIYGIIELILFLTCIKNRVDRGDRTLLNVIAIIFTVFGTFMFFMTGYLPAIIDWLTYHNF